MKKRKVEDVIVKVAPPKLAPESLSNLGPSGGIAATNFRCMSTSEKAQWVENARVRSILGASMRTLSSVKSGVRCYFAFAGVFPHARSLH